MLPTLARQVVTQPEHRLALLRPAERQADAAAGERRFQAVTDRVPDLLWSPDPDGRATWHNRRWLARTGQTAEQALGHRWLEAVHPSSREAVLDALRTAHHRR